MTIKDNILFGKTVDDILYRKVIQSCALEEDLMLLPEGDNTMIGDNGVNLSGGQKQRVSLARAVYSNADIYLLDDCLSAVDVHVGAHLSSCLLGKKGLLAGKTKLMVTHNTGAVNMADTVSYMENGRLKKNKKGREEHEEEKEVCEEKAVNEDCCNGVLKEQLENKISGEQLTIPIF